LDGGRNGVANDDPIIAVPERFVDGLAFCKICIMMGVGLFAAPIIRTERKKRRPATFYCHGDSTNTLHSVGRLAAAARPAQSQPWQRDAACQPVASHTRLSDSTLRRLAGSAKAGAGAAKTGSPGLSSGDRFAPSPMEWKSWRD
jgi:hypothetical protein